MNDVIKDALIDLFTHHNERWPARPIRTVLMVQFIKSCTKDEIDALIAGCGVIRKEPQKVHAVYSKRRPS